MPRTRARRAQREEIEEREELEENEENEEGEDNEDSDGNRNSDDGENSEDSYGSEVQEDGDDGDDENGQDDQDDDDDDDSDGNDDDEDEEYEVEEEDEEEEEVVEEVGDDKDHDEVEKDKPPPMTAEQKKIAEDFEPREPTSKDAKFFFIILDSMKVVPDVDWALVAQRAGYANAISARTRFAQVRRKLRDHYRVPAQPLIPAVTGFPPPRIPEREKTGKEKVVLFDPKELRTVKRKTTKPGAPQNVDKTKPSKFTQNRGQGYTMLRNDDESANHITHANERDDYDTENEYQNDEEFDLNTYHGYDRETNTLTVSDEGEEGSASEDGHTRRFYHGGGGRLIEH
ncbi:hypothetical protein OCU04_001826 [Sclerotinia nivalis]|nr:hypothetical protein OCU04_001826 [Sclerotinia nivalis]